MTLQADKKRLGALIVVMMALMATAALAGTATDKTLGYREYTVYEPSIKYTSSLILAMHPGLSYSSAWRNALPTDTVPGLDNTMDVIADEIGTTVVYPQGYSFAWNAKSPRCCGYTSDINVPDIDYLERVIADVAQDYDLDSTSVYFAGYSNGGMMSMSYACAHPEQVKGIVSASGPMMVDQDECPAFPAVPVTYIYGDSDTTVPPAGGHSAVSNRIYPAAQDVIDFISASGADIDSIEVTGATHDWDSIVSYLSSQEGGLSFASATENLVFPLDYPGGVALWLDASDTSTIIESSGAVSQWNDKSGNGYNATQGTGAKQPVTGTRTLNSKNVIDFNGSGHFLNLSSSLYSIPSGNNTVFVVFASDDTTHDQRLFTGSVGTGTRWGVRLNYAVPQTEFVNNTTFTTANLSVTPNVSTHIISLTRNGSTVYGRRDGGTAATQSAVNVTIDGLKLAVDPTGTGNYFNGAIAEIIVFSRALSNGEMNIVGRYFAYKWGATWVNI